jgi:hypothetical protein
MKLRKCVHARSDACRQCCWGLSPGTEKCLPSFRKILEYSSSASNSARKLCRFYFKPPPLWSSAMLLSVYLYLVTDVSVQPRSPAFKGFRFHFRLPPPCKWDIRSSAMLLSVYWRLVTDVSVQPNRPIFKGFRFHFRLPPPCKWNLRSSAMSLSVYWHLVADVSVQPSSPIFKGFRFHFRLPPPCKWNLHSSAMLLSVYWRSVADVSVQPSSPIFKGFRFHFRLPPPCKWNLLSSAMLLSVYWRLVTDVSVQLIGHNFKSPAVDAWLLKMGLVFTCAQWWTPTVAVKRNTRSLQRDLCHWCTYLGSVVFLWMLFVCCISGDLNLPTTDATSRLKFLHTIPFLNHLKFRYLDTFI